jgi:hypothetical protein
LRALSLQSGGKLLQFRTTHDVKFDAGNESVAPYQLTAGIVRHYSMTAEQLQGNRDKAYGLQKGQANGANWANATCGKPLDKRLATRKGVPGCADYYQILGIMEQLERFSALIRSNDTLRRAMGAETTSPFYCPMNRGCPGPHCNPWPAHKA